jgi:hypothetical protein
VTATLLVVVALLAAACTAPAPSNAAPPLPPRPPVATGALAPDVAANLDALFSEPAFLSNGSVPAAGSASDVRVAWPLVDLLRFRQDRRNIRDLEDALARLTAEEHDGDQPSWVAYSDLLLRWDVPAPPGYLDYKRAAYLAVDPDWAPFFDDDADLDWRDVSWGGVFRDQIRALTDPQVTRADEAGWLRPDDVVFAVAVDGEARAYPKRILDVHELVNDTLAGQRIALPYCTLCGAAIAYRTNIGTELRTSGLLQRSNKLAYDVETQSLLDQFAGEFVTGPRRGERLERLAVTTTTWSQWRAAHPTTTVLARPADVDRYDGDFLGDRDDAGPIFPVGERDARLPAQQPVLGVVSPRGVAVAFPVAEARAALRRGDTVAAGGVALRLDAGGLAARPSDGGPDLPAHEAYWFAWSQFHPGTLLWQPPT